MRVKQIVLSGFLILVGPGSVCAQWVPVVAKVRQTHEIWKDGKFEKVENREGVFYRASDGSTLRYWTQVNGDESRGGGGEINDNNKLIHYSLNMRTKNAHEAGKLPEKLKPTDVVSSPTKESLGDQVLAGIPCHRVPAFVQWPDGRRDSIGENCISVEYALELRTDHKTVQGGTARHVVNELYDVRLGVEPDPKLFDLRNSGVTVYKQEF
jgi:hypothetical protein